jgi:hypothetical protein
MLSRTELHRLLLQSMHRLRDERQSYHNNKRQSQKTATTSIIILHHIDGIPPTIFSGNERIVQNALQTTPFILACSGTIHVDAFDNVSPCLVALGKYGL